MGMFTGSATQCKNTNIPVQHSNVAQITPSASYQGTKYLSVTQVRFTLLCAQLARVRAVCSFCLDPLCPNIPGWQCVRTEVRETYLPALSLKYPSSNHS